MKNKTKFGLMSVIIVTVLIITGFSGCIGVKSLEVIGEGALVQGEKNITWQYISEGDRNENNDE